MAPAAPAPSPGHDPPSGGRRRRGQRGISRRALLQLLAGVLVVGVIPVIATVRILGTNALQNERARADSARSFWSALVPRIRTVAITGITPTTRTPARSWRRARREIPR